MSSYRGSFHDLSPSDQADIASWSEPVPPPACELCGDAIDPEDVSVEAFEMVGALACTACLEALAEEDIHQ